MSILVDFKLFTIQVENSGIDNPIRMCLWNNLQKRCKFTSRNSQLCYFTKDPLDSSKQSPSQNNTLRIYQSNLFQKFKEHLLWLKYDKLARHCGTSCNTSSLEKLRQEDPKFQASWGNLVRSCLNLKEVKRLGECSSVVTLP